MWLPLIIDIPLIGYVTHRPLFSPLVYRLYRRSSCWTRREWWGRGAEEKSPDPISVDSLQGTQSIIDKGFCSPFSVNILLPPCPRLTSLPCVPNNPENEEMDETWTDTEIHHRHQQQTERKAHWDYRGQQNSSTCTATVAKERSLVAYPNLPQQRLPIYPRQSIGDFVPLL